MPNVPLKSKRPEPDAGRFPADPVLDAALGAVRRRRPAVLAGIVGVQGSAPREVGARMLVTAEGIAGTVGGGVLEHMVIQRARSLLRAGERRHGLLSFPLGPDSQQCCGGVVTVFVEPLAASDRAWLERLAAGLRDGIAVATRLGPRPRKLVFEPADPPAGLVPAIADWARAASGGDARLFRDGEHEWLGQHLVQPGFELALFGAGHVGRALVAALAAHRCRVLWIDPRAEEFPASLPANVRALVGDDVAASLAQVMPGSMVLVMTHRHPLDYEICRAVLARGDCAFLGLIGSASKRRRFARALVKDGLDPDAVKRLCCPIGIPQLKGKEPQVIAASVVAQLLALDQERRPEPNRKLTGIHEREAEASVAAAAF